MDIEKQTLNPIDEALAENDRLGFSGVTRKLQEEVWQQIYAGVEAGELTEDEAVERFRAWNNAYCLGKTATQE